MAVPHPVAGLTHDLVLAAGAPGSETKQGIMVKGGLQHYSCQPYTPFAPTAREGEATNRDLALPAVWELQQDWVGGVGKYVERKTEDNGYALAMANATVVNGSNTYYNTRTGATPYTGLAGCLMPPPALIDAGTNNNVKQFIEFGAAPNTKYYFLDSAANGEVWVYDGTGVTPSKVNSGAGAGLGAYVGKQIYTDGSTLYVTRGAGAAVRKTTDGNSWSDHSFNADFVHMRDDGALAYVAGATLTPGAGVAGSPTYAATTIGASGTTATGMVFYKGALWIGKPEGLFSWYQDKVDKRFDALEHQSVTNFAKMVVHHDLLYFNVKNQLFYTDGDRYVQIFPNDAGGFADLACIFPTSGPLLLGGKLLTFGGGESAAYNPQTVVDDNSIGTIAWNDPTNVKAYDDTYATAAMTSTSQVSHYLKCTNFRISLPTNAVPVGIVVDIHSIWGYSGTFSARLVKGGVIGGGTKTATHSRFVIHTTPAPTRFPRHPTTLSSSYWEEETTEIFEDVEDENGLGKLAGFGGNKDLWDNELTRADVVADDFGVAISVTGSSGTVRIDSIELKVFYTILDTSLEQLFMFWGPDAPGLNPLWSDDDGTHPVLAVGATSLFDSTGERIYFCCDDAYYSNKIHYMSMSPRYWPTSFGTGTVYTGTGHIELTEFSAGFRTVPKWWYAVELNVKDPSATTFARVEYCIDGSAWRWLEDEHGQAATLALDDRVVGAYFPRESVGVYVSLRIYPYTTDPTTVAKITHITLRGLTMPKVRYQFAFPANCDHTVPNLTPIADSGETARTFIRNAAAQGYPCKLQDPWGNWYLVKWKEPAPLDVIEKAEKPNNNARQRIYAAVQCVLVEVDELDIYGDIKAWEAG